MNALVEENDGLVFIRLSGCLSYEALDSFRDNFLRHLSGRQIVFNLRELSFVGSSGITDFVDALSELRGRNAGELRFCGVSSEFRRIFAVSAVGDVQIFENEQQARHSIESKAMATVAGLPNDFLVDE